ncbi:MAG: hypothetical protein E7Z86_05790 [Methanosphaera stadtmanae]|nr:hypothetical protein [Methanosphaera stadtmanae]
MSTINDIYLQIFGKVTNNVNSILEKLLEKIEQGDINLETFFKISRAIEDLISFTEKYAFPTVMKYIDNNELLKDKLWDDFIDFKSTVLKLFGDIEKSLINLENNLKNDQGKYDLNSLKNYLEFLGVLFNNFGHILIATINYANNKIDEDEYNKEYDLFKSNFNENKKIFEKKIE